MDEYAVNCILMEKNVISYLPGRNKTKKQKKVMPTMFVGK